MNPRFHIVLFSMANDMIRGNMGERPMVLEGGSAILWCRIWHHTVISIIYIILCGIYIYIKRKIPTPWRWKEADEKNDIYIDIMMSEITGSTKRAA